MVKDHSDNERGNSLPPLMLLFPIRGSIAHTSIAHTMFWVPLSWSTGWDEK